MLIRARIEQVVLCGILTAAILTYPGCHPVPPGALDLDNNIREVLLRTPIALAGSITGPDGTPVSGIAVRAPDRVTTTGLDGTFTFDALPRKNVLIAVERGSGRIEHFPVNLTLPVEVKSVMLETFVLSSNEPNSLRLLFGGDTAFGRRFLDIDESTPRNEVPPDDPAALIQVGDPDPGTRKVLSGIRPFFLAADWGVVNLETPVTSNPATPHIEKDFAYFSLPDSLPPLRDAGVDYVSLGNNHVYDYLELGLRDTLQHLDDAGIAHSGGGLSVDEAFQPFRAVMKSDSYSFVSMTSVSGSQHQITYVAEAGKGGAADLRDDDTVQRVMAEESGAGHVIIAQLHGGKEYTYEPTEYMLDRINLVAGQSPAIIIAHHPHVAQGVGWHNGVLAVHSLGNLVFDQERLETMLALLARVDIMDGIVTEVRLLPVYVEDFQPQPIGGRLADQFLRRIGEFSHSFQGFVYPFHGVGWVPLSGDNVETVERQVIVDFSIPESGETTIDMREWAQSRESLAIATASSPLTAQLGRDILLFGDFDDWDMDETSLEATQWDLGEASSQVSVGNPYRGTASLMSVREDTNTLDSVVPFRNRIRVMGDANNRPEKDLTVIGYLSGQNCGDVSISARYQASMGEAEFGEEKLLIAGAGTYPWRPFSVDLNMPPDNADSPADSTANPRALRLFLRHAPPQSGEGIAYFDELAIVSWEESVDLSGATELLTPHARDFLRVTGPPGSHTLLLTFRSYQPG